MNHLPTIHFLLVSGRVLSTFHILSQIPTQLAVSSCIKPVGFPCFFPTKAIGNIWMFPKIVVPLSYQLSYPFVFHYKPIHFGIYIYIPLFLKPPQIYSISPSHNGGAGAGGSGAVRNRFEGHQAVQDPSGLPFRLRHDAMAWTTQPRIHYGVRVRTDPSMSWLICFVAYRWICIS